ncbi:MAG: hypothetical protein BWY36_00922 [Candidatus Diapherotrites archaeon ADurb.Bin253]|nr:MAG: hypothetical protein BWY36_00922 [Candidatus Diapherotrites archaeon ADurb.Bin253]
MQVQDKEVIKILNILYDEGVFNGISLDYKEIIKILLNNNCLTTVDKCVKCGFPLFNYIVLNVVNVVKQIL